MERPGTELCSRTAERKRYANVHPIIVIFGMRYYLHIVRAS